MPLNPLKGSLNHPKKVTLNHQVMIKLREVETWKGGSSTNFGPQKFESFGT